MELEYDITAYCDTSRLSGIIQEYFIKGAHTLMEVENSYCKVYYSESFIFHQ